MVVNVGGREQGNEQFQVLFKNIYMIKIYNGIIQKNHDRKIHEYKDILKFYFQNS